MVKLLHDKRLIWALFILIAFGIFTIFLLTSINAGQGNLLMPLDDVYIHFQYARQMATGHPYQYNNIDPPTSGATSFIYPYILAFGYLIGFRGLWLGLWAMLIGAIALIAAMWAVYHLCKAFEVPQYLSLLTAVFFALTGSIAWHFMSGMETSIMIALTLWTFLLVIEKRFRSFMLIATLLSFIRPEGGVLAIIASGTMFLRLWHDYGAQEKHSGKRIQLLLLIIPILAIGVQPFVNLLITGTTVATGNQAKSILATIPQDWGLVISRIVDNFLRMWWEFVTGYDALEGRGWYLPLSTGLLGLLAIPMLLFKKNYRLIGLMLLGWLLAMTAAISTLDTAFWHFKRYQMPMLALFFPLAAWLVSSLINRVGARRATFLQNAKYLVYVYPLIILPIFAITLFFQFLHYHAVNVGYIYQQPYQMALWLRENTPEESIIAVHDVGLMRYMGERNTLDIVGLTTSGAAAYWRNGPGSVAEFLINNQPDYIANYGYGHGYGLAYLADTSLYENEVAAFPIENWQPHLNVALAADFQGIYEVNWDFSYLQNLGVSELSREKWLPPQTNLNYQYFAPVLDIIDVADLTSEAEHNYSWSVVMDERQPFLTEVRETNQLNFPDEILDGLRIINDREQFYIQVNLDEQEKVALVTRVFVIEDVVVDVFVDGMLVETHWIPANIGQWFVLTTLLDTQSIIDGAEIRFVPQNNGMYMPAYHVLWSIQYTQEQAPTTYLANYQDHSILLLNALIPLSTNPPHMLGGWYTDGKAVGDYRFFLHLYDDINQAPIAQWDGYFSGTPVGNWLSGYLQDYIYFDDLNTENIPNGTYQLAIGFYNPQNPQDRLMPESDIYEVSPDGRLWIGEITIDNE